MGRATEYTEAMLEKAKEYVAGNNDAISSVAGLAVYMGICRATVYKWKDDNPEFADTLARLLTMQEHQALNNGITGEFNATITKLVLANHGYSDKQEIEQTTNFAMVSDEPLSAEEWKDQYSS